MSLLTDTVNADELDDDGSGSVSLLTGIDGNGSAIPVGDTFEMGGNGVKGVKTLAMFDTSNDGTDFRFGEDGTTGALDLYSYDGNAVTDLMRFNPTGPVESQVNVQMNDNVINGIGGMRVGENFSNGFINWFDGSGNAKIQQRYDSQGGYLRFYDFTSSSEKLRIIPGGAVRVENANLTADYGLTTGPNVTNGSVGSSTSPSVQIGGNGAGFYVSGGEVYVVDEAGNTSLVS